MFKLTQSTTYSWPVAVNIPTNGGQYDKQTFDGVFKRVSDARLKEIRSAIEGDQMTDAQFVRELMVDWKGITDDGAEVPFSQDALDQLLNIPGVAAAIVMAVVESLSGLKRKN